VCLPVIVVHTVNLIVNIHSKGDSIQTLVTDTASETSRMVRLAHGLEYLQEKRGRKYNYMNWDSHLYPYIIKQ